MADEQITREKQDAADASLIGQTLNGKYLILGRLGEGGMGRVYLARLPEFKWKRFAIKRLRPELTHDASFRLRFHDEAELQSQLDHENIVSMSDFFELGGDYFLVLDYVDGQPLSDLIDAQQGRGLPEKQALSIISGVLNGLDCAHRRGIVHRDIKPSNVLVEARGRARITDFGIATNAAGLTRTEGGQVVGTPEYMSPEQLDGGAIDHRSDVFSAGVMLHQMLTGRLPFPGDSFEAVRAQQIAAGVPGPRSVNRKVPKHLSEIVRRAMQMNPAERFQGGPQFHAAIEAYKRRGKWKVVALGLCVLAAAAIYVVQATLVNARVVRETVATAAHDHGLLCREEHARIKNLEAKDIADNNHEADLSVAFGEHAATNEKNKQRYLREYNDVFARLRQMNQWTVRRALDGADASDGLAAVHRAVAEDYDAYATRGVHPTETSMLPRCAGFDLPWNRN